MKTVTLKRRKNLRRATLKPRRRSLLTESRNRVPYSTNFNPQPILLSNHSKYPIYGLINLNNISKRKSLHAKDFVIGVPTLLADTSGLATAAPLRKAPLQILIKDRYVAEMKSRSFTTEELELRNPYVSTFYIFFSFYVSFFISRFSLAFFFFLLSSVKKKN